MSARDEKYHVRVGTMPDDALKAISSALTCMGDSNREFHFCANPEEYFWKCLGKRETLIPFYYDCLPLYESQNNGEPQYPHPNRIRWERCSVWIVEGNLQPGESNLLSRRLFYIDTESWAVLLGEGFDANGCAVKCYMLSKSAHAGTSRYGKWYRIGRHHATQNENGPGDSL